jgi:hypothetical protein
MKKIIAIFGVLASYVAPAQWSNTTNMFEDSLHMPVVTAALVQKNVIVLNSYPDNGFIVIWEDERNTATSKTDIYAQKYDQAGTRLWAVNGVPVSNSANNEHYIFSSSQDYRNRSFAATDSAGGFYIVYADDSLTGSSERVRVQHMRNNGTNVFPNQGFIISYAGTTTTQPQLIADGKKGFFVSWINFGNSTYYLNIKCYKDENGLMKFFGGGVVNYNTLQTSSVAPCGIRTAIQSVTTVVLDYNIWSDGQAGCNVIMNMNGNAGPQGNMLAFNRLWRAKKNSRATTYFRSVTGVATPKTDNYIKDSVYVLYTLITDFQDVICGSSPNVYAYTNYRLLSNGYKAIDIERNDYFGFAKGVTVSTRGNINVDIIAATRKLSSQGALDFNIQGYAYAADKFDSIPYQRTSHGNPDIGYNPVPPAGLNKLTSFRDTLLAASNYFPDFSLAGGDSTIYAAALMSTNNDGRRLRLQRLVINKIGDSFAIQYKTAIGKPVQKAGVAIGSETTIGGYIIYDHPLITVKKNTALLYIRETARSARVSPIGKDVDLTWGAMGVPIGSGLSNGYYHMEQPVVALDSSGANGLIAWRDDRNIPGTGENIFMRHLNNLDENLYSPPHKRIRLLPNPFGPNPANAEIMYGTSRRYSRVDVSYNLVAASGSFPLLDIFDENYLGVVGASFYQQTGAIRRYNNEAYLNRNYAIKTDSLTPGAVIDLKLYFTQTEFDALKGTDNAIINPSYLTVIRQPGTSVSAPATYTPIAGEELLSVNSWNASTLGGYAVEVMTKGFGNFFIKKIAPLALCSGATTTNLTADKTSSSYSWQINSGSGFTPLSIGANYTGTQTATLTITNLPASFNGNLYRCAYADLTVSKTFLLQVANVWTGAVNNQWEIAGNWSCNKVPDANTDVIINNGTVTVNSTTAVCRTLKTRVPANISVGPAFKLTVVK